MPTSMLDALLDEAQRAHALSVEALRLSLAAARHTQLLAKQIEKLAQDERAASTQPATDPEAA